MVKQKGNDFCPKTKLGKWSVWLNVFFLIVIVFSVFLVNVFRVLSYGDIWWDITVNVFLASIFACILGIVAVRKRGERSVLVYISIILGLLSILFILSHSLFIND